MVEDRAEQIIALIRSREQHPVNLPHTVAPPTPATPVDSPRLRPQSSVQASDDRDYPPIPQVPRFVAKDSAESSTAVEDVDDQDDLHITASDDELWQNFDDDIPEIVSQGAAATIASTSAPTTRTTIAASTSTACAPLVTSATSTTVAVDYSGHKFYKEVMTALRTKFRLERFRTNQMEAIMATLEGRDVVVLMPTGGGKSLCYQVPAVLKCGKTKGTTVVISPLIALMMDQVRALEERGVDVVLFTSEQTNAERQANSNRLKAWGLRPDIVYVTPEKLKQSDDLSRTLHMLHSQEELARFVVDEAHLISTWGRDFRDSVGFPFPLFLTSF